MARGATRGVTRCALLLIGTVVLVMAPSTAARGLLSKNTAAPGVEAEETGDKPSWKDLLGTQAPTSSDWFKSITGTAAPTISWSSLVGTAAPTRVYTSSPTVDFFAEMGAEGTVETKGEAQVKAQAAPNFWDLVGTASPTGDFSLSTLLGTSSPTVDWTTKFTSAPTKIYTVAPTMDWNEGFTATPTQDWHNLVGTAAPTADWTLAKLVGTSAPTSDWVTNFFAKPGTSSAESVDAASVTMSPAKVQAQAVSAASSDANGGFSAFFVMVCAIGSALLGGAIMYKYNTTQNASLESTPLISDGASKTSSDSSAGAPAAIMATDGPDSSRGYQAV